jgi:hypothetical protein
LIRVLLICNDKTDHCGKVPSEGFADQQVPFGRCVLNTPFECGLSSSIDDSSRVNDRHPARIGEITMHRNSLGICSLKRTDVDYTSK